MLGLSFVVLLVRIVSEAWVGEDAFITFRVVDNFVNGFGLRWNIDERVMVYTHPLWMLANSAVYSVTREVLYTTTVLGLVLSLSAYVEVCRSALWTPWTLLVVFFLPWVCSPTLVKYSTSGFETSLTMLLIAGFGCTLLVGERGPGRMPWGRLAAVAGLLCINRLDTVLLFGPPLALVLVRRRRDVAWGRVFLGFFPAALWFGFSVFYYGFSYPNTAPAKLSPDFPLLEGYLASGARYLADLLWRDPVAFVALFSGLAVAAVNGVRWYADREDSRAGLVAGLGVGGAVYTVYVVRVGGDFLSGRMWVPPVFSSLMLLVFGLEGAVKEVRRRPGLSGAALVMVAAVAVGGYRLGARVGWRGPLLERSVAHARLKPDLTWTLTPAARTARRRGEMVAARARSARSHVVVPMTLIGMSGFAAGPSVTIVDAYGLGDALLARLSLDTSKRWTWRVGHLAREIPPGYLHARRTGSLEQLEPGLREYYARLSLVVSGPLLDWKRLRTVAAFQGGGYDHLLEKWRAARPEDP